MADETLPTLTLPLLETPDSQVETSLFASDPLAMATAKVAILESFLKLLTKDIKFNDFTREILLIFVNTFKTEAGSIFELEQAASRLFFRAAVGRSSDVVGAFTVPIGQGIVGHVAESRQLLVVANVAENSLHLKNISDAVKFEARNIVALPLLVRGKLYGVIELLNRVGDEKYSEGDLELLTYLGEIAAKTIEIRMMIAGANRADGTKDATKAVAA